MEIEIQKKRYLQKKKERLNSSETAPISTEAPKSCSTRFLLSSNSSTSSSSHLQRKPKTLEPRISKNILKKSTTPAPLKKVMPRSKENKQVLFPQKPKKNQRQSSKINTKPTIKNTQRSKLSYAQGNVSSKSKKNEELETKMKNSSESCSGEQQPYEMLVESKYCSSLNYMFDNNTPGASVKNVEDNSTLKAANLSSGTNVRTPPVEVSESPEINKMLLSKSVATPVCYGAGHHLSGVTDKRKCRRRGSLKGGYEKAKLFDDELSDVNVNVITDLYDSTIPLLVEASVRLELSPCDEGREDLFSPLNSFGNVLSDLVSDDRKDGCLRDSNVNTRDNVIGEASALSLGSLSSGNIIQTPNSNSSLERCVGRFVDFELDSIQETLNRMSLSPKSVVSICDAKSMDLGYTQLKENADNGCSWVSDYTLDNLGLSSMKISWRDEEKDEFDCCRCLSDEEIGVDIKNDIGIENDDGIDSDLEPMILEYEPCICARGDGKMSPKTTNMCAESICTNGGDLVASGDSDWTYFH